MRSFLKPHTRFMLAYWPALLASILLLRLFLFATEGLAPLNNIWQKARIRQGLAAVAAMAQPAGSAGVVVMLGASESLLAFQPLRFDELAAGKGFHTRSFNLSFQNTGTMIPLYFERVRLEMLAAGMRAKLLMVSIPIPRLTYRARETFFAQARYHDIDSVFFEPALWGTPGLSIGDKLILLFNKWLLGERSVVQLQRSFVQFGRMLVPGGAALRASADPFYREEIHPEPAWSPESRGGYYLNIEAKPELVNEVLAAAREPEAMAADMRDLIRCCDLIDLRLDEDYVKQVGDAVRSLSDVADQVVLVTYPESPRVRRPAAAEEAARAAFRSIAEAGRAAHWDASRAGLVSEDYFDLSHLAPSGVEKFNRFLAEALASAQAAPGKR